MLREEAPTRAELLRAGKMIRVRTPRRGAEHNARRSASSGTKYGVVMRRSLRAAAIVATNISDIELLCVVGPVPNIAPSTSSAKVSGSGAAVGRCSRASPVSAIQAVRKMYCSWRTIGPSQRNQMSTHGAYFAATRNCGSAQFWLPQ